MGAKDVRLTGGRMVIVATLLFVILISSSSSGAEGTIIGSADVKSAAVYQPTTARASDGRNAAQLLKGMHTDYVMRGFFKWGPSPAYQYLFLYLSIIQLKQAIPSIVYGGGIAAQYLVQRDTWADGSKISESDFQKMLARNATGSPIAVYDGFLPDLASSLYRSYLVGWSKRQVDAGVDAIFFDGVYIYAEYKYLFMHRPWVETLTEYGGYFTQVAQDAKAYAASKGRNLLVTINNERAVDMVYWPPVALMMEDFISVQFSIMDFQAPFNLAEDWMSIKSDMTSKFGHEILIVAFIDWSAPGEDTAMSRFGALTTTDQVNLIRKLDTATRNAGILFAYPVYGGNVGGGTKYDSVKYGTYDTIASLANNPSTSSLSLGHGITATVRAAASSAYSYGVATPSLPEIPIAHDHSYRRHLNARKT